MRLCCLLACEMIPLDLQCVSMNIATFPDRSDVPLKEYIRSLDETASHSEKFIIAELDDNNLFVKVARAEFVQEKVKEFTNSLHYTKPETAPGREA